MSSDEVVDNKDDAEPKAEEAKGEEAESRPESKTEAKDDAPEVEAKVAGPKATADEPEEEPAPKEEAKAEEEAPAKEEAEPEEKAAPEEEPEEAPAKAVAASHGHEGDHDDLVMEDDRPKNGIIVTTIVVTAAAVVLSVLGIREVYYSAFGAEAQAKIYGLPNAELREVRAEEKAKLNRYQWVSKKDGVVRIPLDRAVSLTLADYKEKAKQAAMAPKPAPTVAPDGTAAPEAPKPAGSAAPDAPKPANTAAPEAPKPAPEAPKPTPPQEH